MKGFRFYEELEHKNRKAEKSKGRVIALALQEDGRGWSPIFLPGMKKTEHGWTYIAECIASLYDEPNGPVCGSQVSIDYLWGKCRRISEDRARSIHPKMFQYLEG